MELIPLGNSFNFLELKDELNTINQKYNCIHFDVSDGYYKPYVGLSQDIIKIIRKNTNLNIGIHLRVFNPYEIYKSYIRVGVDHIIVDYKCFKTSDDCLRFINKVKRFYVKVGIAIDINQEILNFEEIIANIDYILINNENSQNDDLYELQAKIAKFKYLRAEYGLKYQILCEGDINEQNVHKIVEAGSQLVVVNLKDFTRKTAI